MDTYRYADLINAAGDGTADSLIADLRDELIDEIGRDATNTVETVLRELLNAERV